jgi:hypothetical protein
LGEKPVRASALIACGLVAAVADSRGALSGATYVGLALGAAVLLWAGRHRTWSVVVPRLPTRLDLAKARYTYGSVPVEQFERQVGDLLALGEADEPVHVETQQLLLFDD